MENYFAVVSPSNYGIEVGFSKPPIRPSPFDVPIAIGIRVSGLQTFCHGKLVCSGELVEPRVEKISS